MKIINVSSQMGQLSGSSLKSKEAEFQFVNGWTVEKLMLYANDFLTKLQNAHKLGYPTNAYRFSKMLLNMYTRLLAQEYEAIKIVCMCPGWCATSMGGQVSFIMLS